MSFKPVNETVIIGWVADPNIFGPHCMIPVRSKEYIEQLENLLAERTDESEFKALLEDARLAAAGGTRAPSPSQDKQTPATNDYRLHRNYSMIELPIRVAEPNVRQALNNKDCGRAAPHDWHAYEERLGEQVLGRFFCEGDRPTYCPHHENICNGESCCCRDQHGKTKEEAGIDDA